MKLLLICLSLIFCKFASAEPRWIKGDVLDKTDRSAININFDKIDKDLDNAVRKSGDQTISGSKTFTSTVTFSTMTATLGTITTLNSTTLNATNITATTVSASSVTVTNFVTAGWLAAPYPMMIIEDQKAQNTDGGTCTSGSWQTRTLNTTTTNTITGASLSASTITIPSGTYYASWSAPAYAVNSHQTVFRSTDSVVLSSGTVEVANSAVNMTVRSIGSTVFSLTGSKDFILTHRCETTNATDGFGLKANFTTEVYSRLEIWKLR
jgi:hypothetical protein